MLPAMGACQRSHCAYFAGRPRVVLTVISLTVQQVCSLFAFGHITTTDFFRVLVVSIATIGLLEPIKSLLCSRGLPSHGRRQSAPVSHSLDICRPQGLPKT